MIKILLLFGDERNKPFSSFYLSSKAQTPSAQTMHYNGSQNVYHYQSTEVSIRYATVGTVSLSDSFNVAVLQTLGNQE